MTYTPAYIIQYMHNIYKTQAHFTQRFQLHHIITVVYAITPNYALLPIFLCIYFMFLYCCFYNWFSFKIRVIFTVEMFWVDVVKSPEDVTEQSQMLASLL